MKKLLLIGSSVATLALFMLGGMSSPAQDIAVATDRTAVVSTRVLDDSAKNSEQIPDVSPDQTGEVLGVQSMEPAQLASQIAVRTSGTKSSSDVFYNVVDSSNDSREVAYTTPSSFSASALKAATPANLSVAAPTKTRSYGPNGTHWPSKIPTPFMYDMTVPNIIYVEPTWAAVKAAIQSVSDAEANEGTLILIESGTVDNPVVMRGYGNGSGADPVLMDIGKEVRHPEFNPNGVRTKRITVAPSNGYGTLRWENGVNITRVKGVAFAGIITDQGIKSKGNTTSAFAWIMAESSQSGFYGISGQTTYGMEISEYVVPESQAVSDDNVDIYAGGANIKDFTIEGAYLAPRFWLYKDCGTDCPHTDTLQYAAGSGGGYSEMYLNDSVLFASNNSVVQTGNVDRLEIEHSQLVGGSESLRHHGWIEGASKEGYLSAFNGSGKNFVVKDSFVYGPIKLNTKDAAKPFSTVTNTSWDQTSDKATGVAAPSSGGWTHVPGMKAETKGLPAQPTPESLLALWGKDVTPRTQAPTFSPATDMHMTSVSVSLTSSTPGATIYYTTNGTNPTTSSTRYTGPFTLSASATVKAIATSAGLDNSSVQSKTYTVIQPGVPVITTQPTGQTAAVGGTATFTVVATGNPAISGYQWRKNGVNIAGATSASYTTPTLSAADSGSQYSVAVTNSTGTTVSETVSLSVSQLTSTSSFQNHPLGTKTGIFTINFDVSPSGSGTDMVTGLSGSAVTSYTNMSAIVRMKDGKFDVHSSGGTYLADTAVPYVAGQTYRITIDVNVDTDKYSVKVNGTSIASNRTFRTAASSITHLTYVAASGPHTIGNITYSNGESENQAPTVSAGSDQTITLPTNVVTLDATVNDDGGVSSLRNAWTKESGTGTVTFGDDSSVDTTATFSAAGTYVLRLTSDDGDLSTYDELTVIVRPQSGTNQAPVVSAGSDKTISLPTNNVSIDATVTDDGLPAGSSVTQAWTKVSGAGDVSFSNASAVDTTATFSAAGTYVLRLTATDGSLTATDDVTVIVNGGGSGDVSVSGELKKWHKITLSMEGPTTSESATPNPFKDYRANVTFTHVATGKTYVVPGYFAADGNAANTSANSGNIWKAHFAPDETGAWTYSVSFREGAGIAISNVTSAGVSAGFFDGATGNFNVTNTDKSGRDLRGKGRLVYDGEHYLKFSETGERFIKAGVDSPENLLAFADFDNTPKIGAGTIKTYSAHDDEDDEAGDPSWGNGKGKGLIGAVNYLSNQGLNSISFLTFNVGGDDGNVHPFTNKDERERFDVSKMDQWGIVLDHATKKGMYLHFKLMETENDEDQSNDEFKLYARELVARYGHEMALNWNLGEENGRSVTDLKLWATYLKDVDPYDHNRVLHLICGDFSTCNTKYFNLMGSASDLTGFSLQGTDASNFENTFAHVKTYVDESASRGKKWVIGMDEPGDASTGVHPDSTSNNNQNIARKHALWGTIMAGGQGVEWYYGGSNEGDITLQNFRSRDNFYKYSKYAVDFLTSNGLPVVGLTSQNSLISGGSNTGNKVLAKTNDVYLVQLINGGNATLNLSGATGSFSVKWLNPRTGEVTTAPTVNASASVALNALDSNDWIVLLKKGGTPPTDVFNSAGGVVVIEAENTSSSLGSAAEFWARRVPGDARYVANATNDAHLEYRSTDVDALYIDDTPGDVPLEYTFKINETGYYQLHIRSHKNIENSDRPDLNNDAFIKVNGVGGSTFTAGPNAGSTHLKDAPLSMLQSYTKIAGGSASTWAWADQLDAGGDNNKRWPVYGFQAGGTYTLTMSGRSRGFAPDRFIFRKIDTIPMPLAKNYAIPESSKIDGGTNPNIAPITFGSTQVRTVEILNVRPGPSLTSGLVGKAPFGSTGTIIGGPTVSSDNITWWQVDFAATTTDGWVGGDNLEVIPGTGGGTNQAPVVSAGADQSVTLAGTATLDATVADDGRPSNTLTYAWTKVSGPGNVSFASASSVDTTATFSAEGTYVLQLTANDGDLSNGDTVTITVDDVVIPSGPIVYVRVGATGNGTSWSNALGALPTSASLVRGTTYYIADGTYGGYTFDKAKSGTQQITFKKATASDHGDNDGWQSSYGDGQAIFTSFKIDGTGYFTLDGNIGSNKFATKGILVSSQTRQTAFRIDDSDFVTIQGIEVDANYDDRISCNVAEVIGRDISEGGYNTTNITMRKNHFRNGGDDGVVFYNIKDLIFEDNEISDLFGYNIEAHPTDGCGNGHSDGIELKTLTNAVFNRNYFHSIDKTSAFLPSNWTSNYGTVSTDPEERNITVTNNIFHTPNASGAVYFQHMKDAKIFHNTISQGQYAGVIMETKGDYKIVDNFDMSNNIVSSFAIKDEVGNTQLDIDYNLLIGPEVHSFNPHVPSAHDINLGWEMNKQFPTNLYAGSDVNAHYVPGKGHPNWGPEASAFTPAATNPGINKGRTDLPTSVTIGGVNVDISRDFFGNARTGTPDMGAIEFSGTSQASKTVAVSVFGAGDVSGSGISCGTDCSEVYSAGESVTLTATPRANATFTGWSGACSGTGTCSLTVNDFKNVIATFNGGVDPDAWQIGDRVEATKTVRVRSGAGTGFATVIADQNEGAQGTVTGGPASGSGLTWYKIRYDGYTIEGWTGADGLIKLSDGGETDTVAPTVPENLVEVSTANASASISWTASTDNVGVTGYEIYRNGTVVGSSNTNSYTLTGLTAGTTYAVTVKAYDAAGNKSAASAGLSVTTTNIVDIEAPSTPTNLAKGTVGNTSAAISWNASTDNVGVVGYDIYRNGALVGSSVTTSYVDSGLTKDTTYGYTVKAKDAAGNISASSASLSVTTTNVESKIPVRVKSFGPNGTHWPDKIPTPFMYDDTVTSVVINPSWTELQTALDNVTKAQADAGLRILIKPGTMAGKGITSAVQKMLADTGSDSWGQRVVVAPRDGYGTVTWTGGVRIENVQGVAFTGFKVEEPGIRFKGNNRSALAWINISGGNASPTQLLVGASSEVSVADVEIVEVVMRDSEATDSDASAVQGLNDGSNSIKRVTFAGSYLAPKFVTGSGHTDTLQFATGNYQDQVGSSIVDTALFGSSNATLQVGSTNGLKLDHSFLVAGETSLSRYPVLPGGSGPVEVVFNGGSTGMSAFDSIIVGGMGSPKWTEIRNTRTAKAGNAPTNGEWTVDPSLYNMRDDDAGYRNLVPMPTDAYLAQIWAKDGVAPTYRTLTINKTGSGSVNGASSGESFVDGTSVTLTAAPATGATFTGWSGACSGTSTTCTVVMSADKTVTASFSTVVDPKYALTITKTGTGAGTVSGATSGQQFTSGASVTLTASANSGSTFAGWSGACTGTALTCTVVMSADKTVTAMFNTTATVTYVLSANKSGTGSGTISGSAQNQLYVVGSVVTLTATPAAGSTFAGWSGDCSGTGSTCTVTMTSNKSVVATFITTTQTQYSLTINKTGTGAGTVSGATSGQQFVSGTSVTLTAAANSGSTFAGWSGACSGTSSTCTVSMSANKTVGAVFNLVPAGTVATPTFSPLSTTSEDPVSVSISTATAGAEIRYTTNGNTPSSSSTLYTGPFIVSDTRTVKAIAVKSGMTNSSIASATYTITTEPGGPAYTSSGTWASKTFQELSGSANRTGTFEVTFTAKASRTDADVMTGLSNEVATSQYSRFTVFGPIFNFAPNGKIEARDGDDFDAENSFTYSANVNYSVRMLVDVKTRTYSMWVDGVQIANNYAFRSEQSSITQLSRFGYVAKSGNHTMTNVKIGADSNTGGGADTVAPSTPSSLSASSVTTSSANLTWSASTDNVGVAGYEILRNGSVVGTSNSGSYSATGLSAGTTYSFTVRAFDAAGNKSSASSVLPVATASDLTLTSSKAWGTKSFSELSGTASRSKTFTVELSATPLASNSDIVIGLTSGTPTRFESLGPIVRFNPDGKIDARNGADYAAATSVSYSANQTYAIKLVVDVADRTYSAWVGGTQIASNYAFRSNQTPIGDLTNLSYYAVIGSHRMSNISVGLNQ